MEPIRVFLGYLFDTRTILLFVTGILVLRLFNYQQHKDLPPGPRGFPFVGNLPALVWGIFIKGLRPQQIFVQYAERYGSVFHVRFMDQSVVVLNDHESIKEAFQDPLLSDRPVEMGEGVSGASGESWLQMRRFCLTVLRSFGVGKASFEGTIGTEGSELLKEVSAFNGKPFDLKPFLATAVSNVICSVVFGLRYDYDDKNFAQIMSVLSRIIQSLGPGGFFLVFKNIAERFTFMKRKIAKLTSEFENIVLQFVKDHIDVHRNNFDPHNLNDFVDVYLNEANACHTDNTKYNHLANKDSMVFTVKDLFAAGTETTATTLEWCLLYMAIYPDIQKRVQTEIDAVVGRNRLPRLADKPELNLTQAVVWEVQRLASVIPFGLPHVAASDVRFRGFLIPKGTVLVSNLWAIFQDHALWRDPERFTPERFLTDEGQANKPEEFTPFGVGRRSCIGEHLVKMELFIFFSYFMHQFTIKPPEGAPPLTLDGKLGITFSPLPFKICAINRD